MKVIKNSIIFSTLTFIRKGIGFFLLPLYTSYLSTSDYGTVGVVNSIGSFLAVFYGLSLHGAAGRYYHKYRYDKERQKTLWGTTFLFVIINSFILSVIVIVFHKILIDPFTKGVSFNPYVLTGLISVAFLPAYNFLQNRLQAEQRGERFAINNLAFFIVNLSLTLFFVVILKKKAEGILASIAITNMIFATYAIFFFWKRVYWKIDVSLLIQSLKYSLPLVPHHLSGWLVGMVDRLFLNNLKTTAVVGVYNVGYQFANIISTISSAVNNAYKPWFFLEMEKGDKGRKRIISFALFLCSIYSIMGLGIGLFSSDLLKIMVAESFREGWKVIPFLASSFVFIGFYNTTVNTLFLEKTYLVPMVTISSGILNVILNTILIPKYGMIGAGLASQIANFVSFLASILFARVSEKMIFPWLRMILFGLTSYFLTLVPFLLSDWQWIRVFLIKIVMFFVYTIIVYIIYREKLNKQIKTLIFNRINIG
ncbi:lipopolysaccharide biosynthesis protein [Spirochaeta cellobiosiphila]|uniref:lipopolysaccharide biosynthesis protein n=1 Tax=Spirochaeta cellobiosiphila TaxID=504483 RepID=UPI00041E91B4|nr:oligosaccharide flippase family protein [Spirochaeta cellobiosiphila]